MGVFTLTAERLPVSPLALYRWRITPPGGGGWNVPRPCLDVSPGTSFGEHHHLPERAPDPLQPPNPQNRAGISPDIYHPGILSQISDQNIFPPHHAFLPEPPPPALQHPPPPSPAAGRSRSQFAALDR